MSLIDNGEIYKIFIDPLLKNPQMSALDCINPDDRVLDVACGTGAFSFRLAKKAKHVVGIDLSESMIKQASNRQKKLRLENLSFQIQDALDNKFYIESNFNLAVLSMAVHQFPSYLILKIMKLLKSLSMELLIIDYAHPLPKGFLKNSVYFIEKIAGKEHFNNFVNYNDLGGINFFLNKTKYSSIYSSTKSMGVFSIIKCK